MQLSCQALFKQTDALQGLAEAILNDLTEQTAKQDIVRLHRSIIVTSRAMGYFENMSKLWRLAALEQSSGAPVSKWLSRRYEKNQSRFFMHCAGIESANNYNICYGEMFLIL